MSRLLAVIGTFSLCVNAPAQDREPLAVFDALPSVEVLGTGWNREISLLFDSAGKPVEVISTSAQLPDSRRKEHRDEVANPTNRISGWSHAHFDFQGTNRSCRYEVQVERYRSKQKLIEDFERLLALETNEHQKTPVEGIGEAAVVYRDGGGVTLWFRRHTFKVWISPLGQSGSWEADFALKHLAKALDKRLKSPNAGSAQLPEAILPAGSINFVAVELPKFLQFYAAISDAQLDSSQLGQPPPLLISFKNTNAVTRAEAIRLLDQVLLDQASIVVTHPDAKHAMLMFRPSRNEK